LMLLIRIRCMDLCRCRICCWLSFCSTLVGKCSGTVLRGLRTVVLGSLCMSCRLCSLHTKIGSFCKDWHPHKTRAGTHLGTGLSTSKFLSDNWDKNWQNFSSSGTTVNNPDT
jgi:hypothetical protein